MSRRYISVPTPSDVDLVERWLRDNRATFEPDPDPFDLAVDCAHDLEIFDWDQYVIDPSEEFCIPEWIVELAERST